MTQLARHLGDFTLRQMVKTEGRVWLRGAEKKYRIQTIVLASGGGWGLRGARGSIWYALKHGINK